MAEEFDQRVADHMAAFYQRQVGRCAQHLREVAAEIERHGRVGTNLNDRLPDFTASATEIVRDLQRAHYGAPLETLLAAAAEADRYARRGGS